MATGGGPPPPVYLPAASHTRRLLSWNVKNVDVNSSPPQHSVTEVRTVIESQFEELQVVLERAKREVTEILEAEEKQALRQAEGIRVHLEQRCSELKKTQGQMEKISKNENDVDFLQVRPRGPEAQRPRSPEAPRPRGPEAQRPRGPEAPKPRGPEAPRPRGPEASGSHSC